MTRDLGWYTWRGVLGLTACAMSSIVIVNSSRPAMWLSVTLSALANLLLVVNLAHADRLADGARARFGLIKDIALAGYALRTSLIGLAFWETGIRGQRMTVLILNLALYALTVPAVLGYTSATAANDGPRAVAPESGPTVATE